MDEDDSDLLSGDGSSADFLNSTDAASVYTDNQSLPDALDNGTVSTTPSSTTVSPPSWMSTLTSALTVSGQGVSTVSPLLGSTTGGAPKAAAAAAKTPATSSSTMLYIGLAVAALLAFIFLGKK